MVRQLVCSQPDPTVGAQSSAQKVQSRAFLSSSTVNANESSNETSQSESSGSDETSSEESSSASKPEILQVRECDYETRCPPLYLRIENATTKAEWDGIVKFLDTGCLPDTEKVDDKEVTPKQQAMTWVTRFDSLGDIIIRTSQLPLHLALVNKAPSSVVARLVELYPQAVRSINTQGMLPIHLALLHDTCDEIVNYLMLLFPKSVRVRSKDGRTPFQCANNAKDKSRGKVFECFVGKDTKGSTETVDGVDGKHPSLRKALSEPTRSSPEKHGDRESCKLKEASFVKRTKLGDKKSTISKWLSERKREKEAREEIETRDDGSSATKEPKSDFGSKSRSDTDTFEDRVTNSQSSDRSDYDQGREDDGLHSLRSEAEALQARMEAGDIEADLSTLKGDTEAELEVSGVEEEQNSEKGSKKPAGKSAKAALRVQTSTQEVEGTDEELVLTNEVVALQKQEKLVSQEVVKRDIVLEELQCAQKELIGMKKALDGKETKWEGAMREKIAEIKNTVDALSARYTFAGIPGDIGTLREEMKNLREDVEVTIQATEIKKDLSALNKMLENALKEETNQNERDDLKAMKEQVHSMSLDDLDINKTRDEWDMLDADVTSLKEEFSEKASNRGFHTKSRPTSEKDKPLKFLAQTVKGSKNNDEEKWKPIIGQNSDPDHAVAMATTSSSFETRASFKSIRSLKATFMSALSTKCSESKKRAWNRQSDEEKSSPKEAVSEMTKENPDGESGASKASVVSTRAGGLPNTTKKSVSGRRKKSKWPRDASPSAVKHGLSIVANTRTTDGASTVFKKSKKSFLMDSMTSISPKKKSKSACKANKLSVASATGSSLLNRTEATTDIFVDFTASSSMPLKALKSEKSSKKSIKAVESKETKPSEAASFETEQHDSGTEAQATAPESADAISVVSKKSIKSLLLNSMASISSKRPKRSAQSNRAAIHVASTKAGGKRTPVPKAAASTMSDMSEGAVKSVESLTICNSGQQKKQLFKKELGKAQKQEPPVDASCELSNPKITTKLEPPMSLLTVPVDADSPGTIPVSSNKAQKPEYQTDSILVGSKNAPSDGDSSSLTSSSRSLFSDSESSSNEEDKDPVSAIKSLLMSISIRRDASSPDLEAANFESSKSETPGGLENSIKMRRQSVSCISQSLSYLSKCYETICPLGLPKKTAQAGSMSVEENHVNTATDSDSLLGDSTAQKGHGRRPIEGTETEGSNASESRKDDAGPKDSAATSMYLTTDDDEEETVLSMSLDRASPALSKTSPLSAVMSLLSFSKSMQPESSNEQMAMDNPSSPEDKDKAKHGEVVVVMTEKEMEQTDDCSYEKKEHEVTETKTTEHAEESSQKSTTKSPKPTLPPKKTKKTSNGGRSKKLALSTKKRIRSRGRSVLGRIRRVTSRRPAPVKKADTDTFAAVPHAKSTTGAEETIVAFAVTDSGGVEMTSLCTGETQGRGSQ